MLKHTDETDLFQEPIDFCRSSSDFDTKGSKAFIMCANM